MLSRVLAFGAGVALASGTVPATGFADTTVVGSDLSRSPDTVVQHGVDTAVWNVSFAGAGPATPTGAAIPADGQIVTVRLKGMAQASHTGAAPLTQIHFQDLVPQSDGSVVVHSSSAAFDIPAGGDPNQVSEYHPYYFCVHKGDYIAFNDEGGFDPQNYPTGVAYQVLAKVPGSVADEYSKNAGTMNGAQFTGTPRPDQELLQQEVLATGPDALPGCPGGTKGQPQPRTPPHPKALHGPAAVSAPRQTDRVDPRRFVRVGLTCHTSVPCDGTVAITLASGTGAGSPTVGSSAFHLPAAQTSKVRLRLTPAAANLLRHHRRSLPAQLAISTGPGAGPTATTTIRLKRSRH